MYQPYPSGTPGLAPQAAGPPPQPIRAAVMLMYAGAALSAIEIITGLTTIGSLRNAIRTQYPSYSTSQVHTVEVADLAIAVVIGLLAVGLWIWMAWANGGGKSWARIVASVLFALNTIGLLTLMARPHSGIGLLSAVLVWLAGVGAIVMLWQRDSSAYYQARSARLR